MFLCRLWQLCPSQVSTTSPSDLVAGITLHSVAYTHTTGQTEECCDSLSQLLNVDMNMGTYKSVTLLFRLWFFTLRYVLQLVLSQLCTSVVGSFNKLQVFAIVMVRCAAEMLCHVTRNQCILCLANQVFAFEACLYISCL